jgi:xylan 1,4-beta-xylosidase
VTDRPAAPVTESSARIAWFQELGSQTDRTDPAPVPDLAAPAGVRAEPGRGQVTIDWQPVEGAIGYIVQRGDAPDGPFEVIDHHGGDVLATPAAPYTDTTGRVGREAWYAVSALAAIDAPPGPPGAIVSATPADAGTATVEIRVDARDVTQALPRPWRPVIGSEHLAMLLRGLGPGGRNVGEELAESFRIVASELGVRAVRAHAIFDDSLHVYREANGRPRYDYARVDAVYDLLLATGLRPFVELSFMPRDLASDPSRTTFDYEGVISPPRDMGRWAGLVTDFLGHLVARYGLAEVTQWPFEVWNEPNLRLFWAADESDYLRLYDATARAVRAVDERLKVGGPATAAVGWVDDLVAHASDAGVPLDFLSTHTYGAPPLDLRPITARFGRPDLALHWTEWGVSPTHASSINDSVWGAPLVCRGMRSAAGRVDSLAYWVASDHFVELGDAPTLMHGGFGLLTIGNLRKPRYWAMAILERLGDEELACEVAGDGGGGLVEAWASRDGNGRVAIALWNGTLDQSKANGDARLDRVVRLRIDGIAGRQRLSHWRVDASHSNIASVWERMGGDWPDDRGWEALHLADRLEELEPARVVDAGAGGPLEVEFELPMPAVSLIEIDAPQPGHARPVALRSR